MNTFNMLVSLAGYGTYEDRDKYKDKDMEEFADWIDSIEEELT